MEYGISENIINKITSIIAGFPEVEEVVIYGSRAKGNYKPGSDIDLSLKGKNLNLTLLNKIDIQLDDLLLPYTFDLSLYEHLKSAELIEHINRVGKILYKSVH